MMKRKPLLMIVLMLFVTVNAAGGVAEHRDAVREARDAVRELQVAEYHANGQTPLWRAYQRTHGHLEAATRELSDLAGVDTRPRLVVWMTVGGSGGPVEDRTIGWGVKKNGGFVGSNFERVALESIEQCLEAGVAPVVLLHNPYGTLAGEAMQFDQRIHALEAGIEWLGDLPALVGRLYDAGAVEVIVYRGKLTGDLDFEGLLPEEYFARVAVSMANDPAEASQGWDASWNVPADSLAYLAMLAERAKGRTIYVEARPHKDATHLHGWPVIEDGRSPSRFDHTLFDDAVGASEDQLTGLRIQFVLRNTSGDEASRRGKAQRVIDGGHTLAIEYFDLAWAIDLLNAEVNR